MCQDGNPAASLDEFLADGLGPEPEVVVDEVWQQTAGTQPRIAPICPGTSACFS